MSQRASTAVITGASGGIGLEIAKLFVKAGHNVVLVARSADKLNALAESLQKEYSGTVLVLPKDLAAPDASSEVFDWCTQKGLQVDYVVNNAGFGDYGFFHESDWPKQEQMIQLNINTLTQLTHLFLPGMVARKKGRILNVASTAAFQPGPTMAVYFATKAYVLHFSEAISNELKGTGVTVTALCPGATESGFQAAAAMEESRLVKGKRLPSSAEVAQYGYKAMMAGKVVAIHGFLNTLLVTGVRFAPRNIVLKMARAMQEKAK
jgi:uncharacterized protein